MALGKSPRALKADALRRGILAKKRKRVQVPHSAILEEPKSTVSEAARRKKGAWHSKAGVGLEALRVGDDGRNFQGAVAGRGGETAGWPAGSAPDSLLTDHNAGLGTKGQDRGMKSETAGLRLAGKRNMRAGQGADVGGVQEGGGQGKEGKADEGSGIGAGGEGRTGTTQSNKTKKTKQSARSTSKGPRPPDAEATGDMVTSAVMSATEGAPGSQAIWERLCGGGARVRFPELAAGEGLTDAHLLPLPPECDASGASGFWRPIVAHCGPPAQFPARTPRQADVSTWDNDKLPPGSPALLIVCASALRCTELLRQCKAAAGVTSNSKGKGGGLEWRTAKLFAKHMKLEEQKAYLEKEPLRAAAGTPNRLLKLLQLGALKLGALQTLVLDLAPSVKGLTLLDEPQVSQDLKELYFVWFHRLILSGVVKLAIRQSNCKLS